MEFFLNHLNVSFHTTTVRTMVVTYGIVKPYNGTLHRIVRLLFALLPGSDFIFSKSTIITKNQRGVLKPACRRKLSENKTLKKIFCSYFKAVHRLGCITFYQVRSKIHPTFGENLWFYTLQIIDKCVIGNKSSYNEI